jgi:hypothetical protein
MWLVTLLISTIKPELLATEKKEWGKITGIIHGAGRLADKLISR